MNRGEVKRLTSRRTAYWDSQSGTVVITDPSHLHHGTAFRPPRGQAYFDGLL